MTHASVFSGIGGPEVAATMLGWDNLFHCEINPFGRRVLDYWYPNSKSYEDITTTDFTEWRGRVNVLTGGFPCQPFSYAGKRGGAQDDRYLWPYMFRCIDQIRPDWVVAENVAGILTMVEQGEVSEVASAPALFDTFDRVRRYQLRETFTLQRICDDLEGHGYAVQPVLVPACGVGAPHRRDRVFIIAHTREPRAEGVRQERQDAVHRTEPIADTDGWRGFEVEESIRLQLANGTIAECVGGQRTSADTSEQSGKQLRPIQSEIGKATEVELRRSGGEDGGVSGCCRWKWEETAWLPTQSPIHRGDDGLSIRMDGASVPFTKWRNEALKAYGNAIVPQVMYEIFRAIQQVEQDL